MNNLFLTLESWVIAYIVIGIILLWIAKIRKEAVKTTVWVILLVITIVFISGIFFEEVRIFFYRLAH